MSPNAVRMYQALPIGLQSLVASAHGLKIRRWRYGPETEAIVAAALDRERWNPDRLQQWQLDQVGRLLRRTAERVPYYRAQWAERRRRGDQAPVERLENWPVLSKQTVRANAVAFVADDVDIRRLYHDHTSGTTGTPLNLWLARDAVRGWYALAEARMRRWHGLTMEDRYGLIGGQPITPPEQKRPPFWVWNAAMNQLYLSAMHIAPWSVDSYLEAIRAHQLRYLHGYSSSLYFLALAAKERGLKLPLRATLTHAEPLYGYQRRVMNEGFEGVLQETYGQAEAVCAASECHHHRMHLWPEVGITEIVDDNNQPVVTGKPGRIIATGLLNTAMPLIRYDIGDRGRLSADTGPCACGRTLPVMEEILGRWDDVVVTKDGRQPVLLDRIFDPPVRIKEGQIIQKAVGKFVLRIVPTAGWTSRDEMFLSKALIDLVGEAEVSIELVEQIERTWAGKFRIIISEVGNPSATA